MTRRYRESKTSASRRALLPIVGAIPLAVAVTCFSATGDAAARPSVPAPAPFEQLWIASGGMPGGDSMVHGASQMIPHAEVTRAINSQNLYAPEPSEVGAFSIPAPESVPDIVLDQAKDAAAATNASIGSGLHSVDDNYSDRVTRMTVDGGNTGLVIGAAVGAIPGAVVGAVPGAIIGGVIGAIVGGIGGGLVMAVPTLGVGAPLGAAGGALAGAGVGAVVGGVLGGAVTAIPCGLIGGAVGYALGAATGLGNGMQN
ncbi:hypothetical protein [Nocardia aurantiaca]|uniref:Glycine zipper domain-containing protein n=1 Tax=Nocardia aurantiaca TaxID=2675850 RepID=A0A6I3L495_9NOCA|nr:hypothetical protein [Nocardia aurantiaca]MTE16667.1 hypothetical protein [Nocardia aurantiaca]